MNSVPTPTSSTPTSSPRLTIDRSSAFNNFLNNPRSTTIISSSVISRVSSEFRVPPSPINSHYRPLTATSLAPSTSGTNLHAPFHWGPPPPPHSSLNNNHCLTTTPKNNSNATSARRPTFTHPSTTMSSSISATTTRTTRHSINNPPSTTPKSTISNSRTLVESVDDHTYVAVVEGSGQARGEVGMACLNLRTSNLILCQFADTQSYHRVISKLNIFRPHQILMPSTCCERTGTPSQLFTQLRTEVSNVDIVPILRKTFSEGRGLQRVKHLVVDKFSTVVQVVTQKFYCLAAAAALLKYIELVQSIIFSPKSMKVEFQGSDNTCMIDSKTAQNLELLHNTHKPVSAHSVHGILSNCRTPGGARLLRMHILQPPCDLKLIQQRLDCVDELMESREVLCGLEDILARIPLDIEHVISTLIQIPKSDNWKITEQRINFVIALKHILELLPALMTTLESTTNEFFQTIREELRAPVFEAILEKIKTIINDEVQLQKGLVNMRRQRCFAVKADINPILDISRKAYCEIVEEMNKHVTELSNKHNMALRLGENVKRSYYMQLILPGKGDRMPNLPNIFLQVKKYRNVINFTTEGLLNLDHRCKEVRKEIEKFSAIVVTELVTEIREDISSIYTISEAVAQLDVLYALCKYALTTLRCVRPRFSKFATSISNGRHPVLELVKNDIPVPNSTFLTEDTNFALITGPNMSGKTTYLKQVATLQILAQIGSFVPAESATFRIASNIFSRLGTGDNIEDNASSFAMEMTEMKYIIDNINDNSLVIIDELGRGTSVEEGTAISVAIAEWLLRTKSFILFATHYLFLTRLEGMYLNVLNYTMETQEWRLKPDVERDDQQQAVVQGEIVGVSDDASLLSNCKLKYTHVLKRGVTEVEYYGLKLASMTSYPPKIVAHALSIAESIVENRKNPGIDSNAEERERDRNLHLLGSHLKLLSEMSDSIAKEDLEDYLVNLQQEFSTTFGGGRTSATVTSTPLTSANEVNESEVGSSLQDANSEEGEEEASFSHQEEEEEEEEEEAIFTYHEEEEENENEDNFID